MARPRVSVLLPFRRMSRVYRRLARLHSAIPYSVSLDGRAFPPWHYFLEVTRRCNLRCRMCAFRDYVDRHTSTTLLENELTLDEWKGVIDQTSRWSLITFTGGEPWVRQDFDELLEYACAKRRVHVITNGLLITDERARRCVDLAPASFTSSGLVSLGISLDGMANTHDRIRERGGAFDETVETIRRVVSYRAKRGTPFPVLHVTAVIQQDNIGDFPRMARFLAKEGVDVFNLTMEVRFTDFDGLGEVDPEAFCGVDLRLPRIDPIVLENELRSTQAAAEDAGIELRLPNMPLSQILAYHDGGLDLRRFTCRSPWTNISISAQGNVYPCFIYKLGNVRRHALKTLWNAPETRRFRQRLRQELFCICQGCCHLDYKG